MNSIRTISHIYSADELTYYVLPEYDDEINCLENQSQTVHVVAAWRRRSLLSTSPNS